MKEVFTTPEARPDSLGSTSRIAASITGLSAMPQPMPSSSMPGSTWSMKLPPEGATANSPRPAAASSMPPAIGSLRPKRIIAGAQ